MMVEWANEEVRRGRGLRGIKHTCAVRSFVKSQSLPWFSVLKLGYFFLNVWFKVKPKSARNSVFVISWRKKTQWLVGVILSLGTTGMQLIRMSNLKSKDGHDKSWVYYVCGMLMNILPTARCWDIAGYAWLLGEKLTPRRLFRHLCGVKIAAN